MGEHADDTMNWDIEASDFIHGDGGPGDQAIMDYVHGTLRATPQQVQEGMRFQKDVRIALGPNWTETRRLIMGESFPGRCESQLSRYDFSELNYQESVRGDLTDRVNDTTMECQTAVSGIDVSWEHSKRQRSQADFQCFGFKSGTCLVVRTSEIRKYLDHWNVSPRESLRENGGPFYSFGESFLRSIGAVSLDEWIRTHG